MMLGGAAEPSTSPKSIPITRCFPVKTRPGGFIRIAVRRGDGERDGDWYEGLNFDEGVEFRGDSTGEVVNWKGKDSLDSLEGDAIRLHFWMQKAELYSFWFE